jgi:glucose/arabinose dehydrogenase
MRDTNAWSLGPHLASAAIACVATTLLLPESGEASRFGRNGFSGNPHTNGGSDCTVCHAPGAAAPPAVRIEGPVTVDAGTTGRYTVTVAGSPAITAGLNVSVSDAIGRLAPAAGDDRLQRVQGELAHVAPQPFGGNDQLAFDFLWQAPNYDTQVRFYVAGNATDGNLDLLGDAVATATLAVSVENGFEEPPPPPPPAEPAPIALERIASGLTAPVVVTNAGDARLFVVEQAGRIRVIDEQGRLLPQPFLDLRGQVKLGGSEEGMLGLAFHPDYADNGYFYVNYIIDPGGEQARTRVSRFEVSDDPNVAAADSERVLMEFTQPFSNHNGGDMHFGPDGLLYIASGDGGSAGDPEDLAQDPQRLLGKILRLDVDTPPGPGSGPDCGDSETGYAIPPDNAYTDGVGGAGCDEIYALGVRNPWRFSFDRATGDLWVADVGQNRIEEVSVVAAGSPGGLNLGWRCFEGSEPFDTRNCDRSYLDPVFEYPHSDGNCSITGGYVYRGEDFPSLQGQYLFSDFCNPAVRALSGPVNDLAETEVLPAGDVLFTSFGEDHRGELYGADFAGGGIYRLVATRGGGVEPIIQVNDSRHYLRLPAGSDAVATVALRVDAAQIGTQADWWAAASTSAGWYSYLPGRDAWVFVGDSPADLMVGYQGPLGDLEAIEILDVIGLSVGRRHLYFGVDTNRNGQLDLDQLEYDLITIDVR